MSERDPFSLGGHTQPPLVARLIESKTFPSALADMQRVPVSDPLPALPADRDPSAVGGRTDPLLVLAAERRRLIEKWEPMQDAADAIMMALPNDRRPGVQVGIFVSGNERRPMIARSEEAIRSHCQRHRDLIGSLWGKEAIQRSLEKEEALVAELKAQIERKTAIEDAAGYTDACARASEVSAAWTAIEKQMMVTTATTAEGVVAQLELWVESLKDNELSDDEIEAVAALITAGVRGIARGQP